MIFYRKPQKTMENEYFLRKTSKNHSKTNISCGKPMKTIRKPRFPIENNKKPFTDDKITKLLNKEQYPIARRTVTKYIEMIGASVARLRRKL